jgi:nucleotide-binding universal stress UspA family protein
MKILLATDGSDNARAAGDFLTRFAFPAGTEVRLLNVIRDTFLKYEEWEDWQGQSEEHRTELQEAEQLLREEREGMLSTEAERLGSAGWTCSTEVRIGQPADEILGATASLGSNLIVLSSVGASGLREFHLGRVANAVLEYAPFSVLLVKPPGAAEAAAVAGTERVPLRILVAFDGSPVSRKAVDFCQSLPLDAQTEVHVLAILRLMRGFRHDIQQRLSDVWRQKKTAAKTALESVSKDEKWTIPNVTSELLESLSVTEAILDVATQRRSDLIVLGNKGKGSIESFLLGSGTRRITRHAPCSVLAVRA